MIKPTVGRVVWVWRKGMANDKSQPEVGLIVYVWSDRMINVAGFDHNGDPYKATSLLLLQDNEDSPQDHACWMPYQKGQAQKTEALEAAAAVAR